MCLSRKLEPAARESPPVVSESAAAAGCAHNQLVSLDLFWRAGNGGVVPAVLQGPGQLRQSGRWFTAFGAAARSSGTPSAAAFCCPGRPPGAPLHPCDRTPCTPACCQTPVGQAGCAGRLSSCALFQLSRALTHASHAQLDDWLLRPLSGARRCGPPFMRLGRRRRCSTRLVRRCSMRCAITWRGSCGRSLRLRCSSPPRQHRPSPACSRQSSLLCCPTGEH